MIPSTIKTWQMTVPGTLTKTEIPVPQLQPGEVLVEVKGCGCLLYTSDAADE